MLDIPVSYSYNLIKRMSKQSAPVLLASNSEVQAAVSRLASEIKRDYQDKSPILIGILKGSFMFIADLVRQLDFPVEIEFVRLSSYGKRCETSGKIKVVHGLCARLKGRHVLVVEDIIDTGLTASFFLDYLNGKKPASLRFCVLMDKPSRRQVTVDINYRGFTVPDKFIVGYGTDWNEMYRNLPEVYTIEVPEC